MNKFGKILLAVAATALAMTAFASSAMAADGVLRDVTTGNEPANGTVFHYVGWAKFAHEENSFECHVTAETEAENGTSAQVTNFTVSNTENCEGKGAFAGCELTAHESTNLPWHVTTTESDFDITGNIVIDNTFGGCTLIQSAELVFAEVTATPLATGSREVTGTGGNLGGTAGPEAPIAGIELSGNGEAHLGTIIGPLNEPVEVTGELELTAPNLDTWLIAKE